MNHRFLLILQGCPHCIKYFDVITRINSSLEVGKRINIYDVTSSEEHNINMNPLLEIIKYSGTPYLYIDGATLSGALSTEFIEGFLTGMLKEELK